MPLGIHPTASIEYLPEGSSHIHLVPLGDGKITILETEEAAELLADAVFKCTPDKHNGHGLEHSPDDVENAYKSGIHQLLTRDYDREEAQRQLQKVREGKWYGPNSKGGPVPEFVLFPDASDAREWMVLLTEPDGSPHIFKANKKLLDGAIPDPDMAGARPDKSGVSWLRKPQWNMESRLRRMTGRPAL
tara:strand:+ start:18929 stop:19495 length:567 start_codon:yes stop_codon:yes gene_type:complete